MSFYGRCLSASKEELASLLVDICAAAYHSRNAISLDHRDHIARIRRRVATFSFQSRHPFTSHSCCPVLNSIHNYLHENDVKNRYSQCYFMVPTDFIEPLMESQHYYVTAYDMIYYHVLPLVSRDWNAVFGKKQPIVYEVQDVITNHRIDLPWSISADAIYFDICSVRNDNSELLFCGVLLQELLETVDTSCEVWLAIEKKIKRNKYVGIAMIPVQSSNIHFDTRWRKRRAPTGYRYEYGYTRNLWILTKDMSFYERRLLCRIGSSVQQQNRFRIYLQIMQYKTICGKISCSSDFSGSSFIQIPKSLFDDARMQYP